MENYYFQEIATSIFNHPAETVATRSVKEGPRYRVHRVVQKPSADTKGRLRDNAWNLEALRA